MAIGFIVLVAVFAVAAGVYLWRNDFASETIEVIFPAVGAILFCIYLGIKSIVVDAPAPQSFDAVVAVFHDSAHGKVIGIPPPSTNLSPGLDEFRGSLAISTLPLYNAFDGLHIEEALKAPWSGVERSMLEDVVEYAVLAWFRNGDVEIGVEQVAITALINGGGGGFGGAQGLVATQVRDLGPAPSGLLAKAPLTINLPPHSLASRTSGNRPSFEFKTCHSKLTVSWPGTTMSRIDEPIGAEAIALFKAMKLPARDLGLTQIGFRLHFEFKQASFSRYSEQAKREARWFGRVQRQFLRDFSWEHARARALQLAAIS